MFHGNTVTHVDSPCHIFWDGAMYNGRSHALVDTAIDVGGRHGGGERDRHAWCRDPRTSCISAFGSSISEPRHPSTSGQHRDRFHRRRAARSTGT